MNNAFLGLGASSLVTHQIPYYTNIAMTVVYILIGLITTIWSCHMISQTYEEEKKDNKDPNKKGKIIKIIESLIVILYSIGEIIIHQILIFRSFCGIMNILGGYNYAIINFNLKGHTRIFHNNGSIPP
jgi:uncharacterized membrane protein YuzA (DUF378 family)